MPVDGTVLGTGRALITGAKPCTSGSSTAKTVRMERIFICHLLSISIEFVTTDLMIPQSTSCWLTVGRLTGFTSTSTWRHSSRRHGFGSHFAREPITPVTVILSFRSKSSPFKNAQRRANRKGKIVVQAKITLHQHLAHRKTRQAPDRSHRSHASFRASTR